MTFNKKQILSSVVIMGITTLFLILSVVVSNREAEQIIPLMSHDEYLELWKDSTAEEWTIPIINKHDVLIIKKTDAVILTQEPNYVVIVGNEEKIEKVISLGFDLHEPQEWDIQKRSIKVWINNREDLEFLRKIASDVFPGTIPGYFYAGAYDAEIEWFPD